MGNKINPNCNRLFLTNSWLLRHSDNFYFEKIKIYTKIKKIISSKLGIFNFEDIYLEFLKNSLIINIFSSKPGYIIGKDGSNILNLKNIISKKFGLLTYINVKETFYKDYCFSFFFENISKKIKLGINYKFFIKNFIKNNLNNEVIGIKIQISGRINGSEIARKEIYKEGKISLNTISRNVIFKNYSFKTKYGIMGIKMWYCLN
ncbi:30S ribosomal protein S3 [Candidatus Vidania fulgoroideorum]